MRIALLLIAVLCMPVAVNAQDPTKVDAKHYSVMFENDQVRVLKISYAHGEKSVLHEHPDAVAVFVTANHAKFGAPDGTSMELKRDAGEVMFTPAGKHQPENLGDTFQVVLVELKGKAGAGAAMPLDAVKVDPDHHQVAFENDRVRVLRVKFAPGDKSKEHEHPNSVAVQLTAAKLKVTTPDGKSREAGGMAGGATWLASERHVVENTTTSAGEVILVELK